MKALILAAAEIDRSGDDPTVLVDFAAAGRAACEWLDRHPRFLDELVRQVDEPEEDGSAPRI